MTHSIAAIFRNEAPYLREWIEFHLEVGFDHFYLFDNLSTDSFLTVLQPYIDRGIVECQSWPLAHSNIYDWNEVQCLAYERALYKAKGKAKWLAILDTDEFLFSPSGKSVAELLKNYESFAGIGVNWQVFGTSSVAKIPAERLLIESLTQKLPETQGINHHIKSIVQPERIRGCESPHFAIYKPGHFQVNTAGIPFEGLLSPTVELDVLRINHYILRDEHFFHSQKIPRLQSWWGETISHWEAKYSGLNQMTDKSIASLIPNLKKRLLY